MRAAGQRTLCLAFVVDILFYVNYRRFYYNLFAVLCQACVLHSDNGAEHSFYGEGRMRKWLHGL